MAAKYKLSQKTESLINTARNAFPEKGKDEPVGQLVSLLAAHGFTKLHGQVVKSLEKEGLRVNTEKQLVPIIHDPE